MMKRNLHDLKTGSDPLKQKTERLARSPAEVAEPATKTGGSTAGTAAAEPAAPRTPETTVKTNGDATSQRLLSIDALRGFDMLLISGGTLFLVRMEGLTGIALIDWMAGQMRHAVWEGFTFYDFIMPLFLFITGLTIPFSINKWLSTGANKAQLYRKMFWRMLILMGLGILYKNAPVSLFDPSEIRYVSVLGRIGIAGFVTAVLYLNFSGTRRLAIAGGILVGYYAALFLIPVPGYGAGNLTMEGNLVGWFDRTFLPGRLHQGIYDELGLLTQFPSLCLTIFGAWAGDILHSRRGDWDKVRLLYGIGALGIVAGLIWGMHFPIVKRLWSSSFILLTAGMSFVSIGLFYMLIDVMKYRRWAFFFQVIGLNSLTIYLAYRFIDFGHTSRLLFSGIYAPAPEAWYPVFQAVGALMLVWLFLYILYRKKMFLKV